MTQTLGISGVMSPLRDEAALCSRGFCSRSNYSQLQQDYRCDVAHVTEAAIENWDQAPNSNCTSLQGLPTRRLIDLSADTAWISQSLPAISIQ
ncbi:hypothetical protein [Actibacterium lipolyticum]|uniref:Uncharacterized protein n=1 Tax=Actibacterium lipolyticum TaxID=1524263 RepID=A0A238KGU0_9RHOB|nr:hypothetical protein [Actibacterium lipolyticum]SMX41897.1 hypothetical protein COL8621_01848 [Actibacterium lipolyticum]